MKRKILLRLFALVAAMMCALGTAAAEAYACYTSADSTLTFYYDNLRSSREGTTYNLNTDNNNPDWRSNGPYASVTKVVFNSSFANARPTSTFGWFTGMSSLRSITGISYLNTEDVTNMRNMFNNCSALMSLDVSHFNTSNVTNMGYMFYNCSGLTSLDVSSFNTANVTRMDGMFYQCNRLTSLDVSHFNTANVTNMSDMFRTCLTLTSLDVSHFNTSNVTNMGYMFANCSQLTSIDVSNFNTAKVTGISGMFSSCSNLSSLDLRGFNTANVKNISYMFYNCSKLITIYAGGEWSTAAVTSSSYMFTRCTRLVGGMGTTYDENHVDAAYAHIDGGTANPGYLTAVMLDVALNYEDGNIHFNSTGDYPWTILSEGDRLYAQSSNAGIPKSSSTLTATVTVDKATTLSFEYKAWGEGADLGVEGAHYDECSFSIDGVKRFACGKRDNDWEVYTVEMPAGTHALEWSYAKDSSVNPPGDYFAVDNVVLGGALLSELDRALNIEGGVIHFVTTGDYPWTILSEGNRLYAQSSNAGVPGSSSTLTAEVTTAHGATLSFEYKAWGEGADLGEEGAHYDECSFSIDGVKRFACGKRDNDWEVYTVEMPAGTHTLEWSYAKDSSVNPPGDYFAVDNVAIVESASLRGDVNGDDAIDVDDVTRLIDVVLGKPLEYDAVAADCNVEGGSGGIDIDDVTSLIGRILTGYW